MRSIAKIMTAAAVLSLLLAACSPSQSGTGASSAGTPGSKTAYMLREKLGLTILKDPQGEPGVLKWLGPITLGEALTITGDVVKLTYSGSVSNFVPVKRNLTGEEGYTWADYLAVDSSIAVVVADDAYIFTQPQTASQTNKRLPLINVVGVDNSFSNDTYYRIKAYTYRDGSNILHPAVYVRRDKLSLSNDDVQVAILLHVSESAKDEGQKQSMLSSALKDFPNSKLAGMVRERLGIEEASGGQQMAESQMMTNRADVPVMSDPDETSTLLVTLPSGAVVTVVGRSDYEVDFDGMNAYWYKISSPSSGWVFGGYLFK